MKNQIISLYKLLKDNEQSFVERGLNGNFFVDIFRGQLTNPELYEYFSLPAIFVDYQIAGQGRNKPRLVTLTLHIVLNDMPDMSNLNVNLNNEQISDIIKNQQLLGFNRLVYLALLQKILEGKILHNTSPLRFISEGFIDEPVINYHTQTYDFEVYLQDMIDEVSELEGYFEKLNVSGKLVKDLIVDY